MPSRTRKPENHEPSSEVYLWLCSEGWVRLGPYAWIGFDTQADAFIGPGGVRLAVRGLWDDWRVPEGRYSAWNFHRAIVTSSRAHPVLNLGDFPVETIK